MCPQLGTWPATRACALTGNRTGDLSVGSQAGAQPTESHQPGQILSLVLDLSPGRVAGGK